MLHQADLNGMVRIVDIPPAKQQLVQNRDYDRLCTTPHCVVCPFGKKGDCMVSGVVYLITVQHVETRILARQAALYARASKNT